MRETLGLRLHKFEALFMSRILSTAAALMMFSPAWADDVQTLAPVSAVTLYPSGASLTRKIVAEMPAGSHRILFPAHDTDGTPPRITSEGVSIGAIEILRDYIAEPEKVFSPSQASALARVETLQDAVEAQKDRVARSQASIAASQAHIAYLETISGASVEVLDPDSLRNAGTMIASEIKLAHEALQAAKTAARVDIEALEDRQKELAQATRDLARLSPPEGPVDMVAVSVNVPVAGPVELDLEQLVRDAYWQADYDLRLDRDTGQIDMARKVIIEQETGEAWEEVALTLSTADPRGQINPREVYPNLAAISGPLGKDSFVRSQSTKVTSEMERSSALIEEPVIVEDSVAGVRIDGLSVTYVYPEKVNLGSDQGGLILALDELQFDVEVFNRAAPRYDETAFLMAKFTNTGQEPLLPGEASLYRDDVFIGRGVLNQVPAGAEAEVAFGALETLRLEFTLLKNDTGDTGLLSSSSTRSQSMEFTLENLSAEAQQVETIFPMPFSEQEDLSVRVRARPAPDSTDFEKRRGVSVWDLELAPGQKQTVRLDVELAWPEGQQLQWRP
jgi:uncharacterized protein (TIGR02231 family)